MGGLGHGLTQASEWARKIRRGIRQHQRAELPVRLKIAVSTDKNFIYLRCDDTDVLFKRIAQRGRKEEAGIRQEFLDGLGAYYRTFPQVAQGKYKLDLLSVDVARFDIRTAEGKERFLGQVETFLQK